MTDQAWEALCGDLPDHAAEVMSSHPGQPTVEEQDRTHGAGAPAPDHGTGDQAKYA
jgi:hypothetical protein